MSAARCRQVQRRVRRRAGCIQGFGDPVSRLGNKPIAFFAQDSWKIRPNFTLNYGVRYDLELTEQIATLPFRDPLSGINLSAGDILAAQDALNVQQGFPRDKNNWAPRIAVAWDIHNNAKTVVRAAYGLFYDHPLLAIGFNSDIADAVQQQQGIFIPGSPAIVSDEEFFKGLNLPDPKAPGLMQPVVVKEVWPQYTREAMQAKLQGTFFLQCVIMPDGTVGRARLTRIGWLDAPPIEIDHQGRSVVTEFHGLDVEAMRAVSQWRFQPALLDGKAVPFLATLTLQFRIF